jgi:hypothetical protein
MAWIESHGTLRNHPKLQKAARMLGVSEPAVIGHLHCLWWWALEYATDGQLAGYEDEDIAQACEWPVEDTARLIDALVNCGRGGKAGFLERTPGGALFIHDWYDYAGKLIERRKADAERKRGEREPKEAPIPSDEIPLDVHRTSLGHPTDGARTVPYPTVPNRTVPNQTNQHDHGQSADADDVFFSQFWSAYPRKVAKQSARQAWDRCLKAGATPEQLVACAGNYAEAMIDAGKEYGVY